MISTQSGQINFIVHRAALGFGDSLIALCAAYDYAMRYKAPLIIDWRNSRWLSRKIRDAASFRDVPNLFEIIFDNRDRLGAVRIITDPKQIYEIIPEEKLIDIVNMPEPLNGEIRKLYHDGREEVLPRNYDSSIKYERRMLIQSLRFSKSYSSKVDDFLKKHNNKDMIAIHIRIGNGEFWKIKKSDMRKAVIKAEEMVRSIDNITNERYCLYVASDTPEIIERIKEKFKKYEVIDYPGVRPPQSTTTSHMYVNADTPEDKAAALFETSIAEMLILSKAKYLISIHSKGWISGFVYYARNFIAPGNCYYVTNFCFKDPFKEGPKKSVVRILKDILSI